MDMRDILLFMIISFVLLSSCSFLGPNKDNNVPDWYPSRLEVSENNLAEFNSIATDFSETFEVDKNNFIVDSLTACIYRIYSLNIPICTFSDSVDDFKEFNHKVTDFLQAWYRIFCLEWFEVDTMHYTGIEGGHHGADIFIQSNYSIPIYDGSRSLGSIAVWMDGTGKITKLGSSLLPQLRIPSENIISLEEAKAKLNGYKYSVYSWTGESERVFSISQIEETALEIYIDRNYSDRGITESIDYRLVWRITTFDGDFFVDSQTREIVGFIQGWIS
jgi:hypothetical protein